MNSATETGDGKTIQLEGYASFLLNMTYLFASLCCEALYWANCGFCFSILHNLGRNLMSWNSTCALKDIIQVSSGFFIFLLSIPVNSQSIPTLKLYHLSIFTEMLMHTMFTNRTAYQVTWNDCLQPCLLQVIQAPHEALLSLPWSSHM